MRLFQITAPYFCAGLIVDDMDVIIEAAPILKWTLGKDWLDIHDYFIQKRYKIIEDGNM